ncbi:hypothetical protein KY335_02075 [Candidatus Woesearchaeota archaeon]|nr:hypothetical protein [Candidatus Woesearchaeota archaeon]MBW3014004.1 hypothetical protein [Candidatus Woesearchaeota archaeon]
MDEEERRLWHMIDTGDFISAGSIFSCNFLWIKEGIDKGKTDFSEQIEDCRETYQLLEDRFNEMDLDALDSRFPVKELRTYREATLPDFKRKLLALYFLLEECPMISKVLVNGVISACDKHVDRMSILRESFTHSERYIRYRETKPKRIYLLAKKRAEHSMAV